MSTDSKMSLSFGIGLVVKPLISPGIFSVVIAGRSMTKIIKTFQSPSAMTERDGFIIIFFLQLRWNFIYTYILNLF